eukprot:gene4410-6681_t
MFLALTAVRRLCQSPKTVPTTVLSPCSQRTTREAAHITHLYPNLSRGGLIFNKAPLTSCINKSFMGCLCMPKHSDFLRNGWNKLKPISQSLRFLSSKKTVKVKKKQTEGFDRLSKKRKLLLEKRKAAGSVQFDLTQKKQSKKSLDFSPQAQGCDVLTALEREEMYLRRKDNPIPEFYPGSILRITYHEAISKNSPKRMVGICIGRRNAKLGSTVTIRNVDDGIPFEAKFDIYSPLVDKIEVLELSRRRRAKLYYLRDRPEKESYVSPNFQPVPRPENGMVPVKVANPFRQKTKSPEYKPVYK